MMREMRHFEYSVEPTGCLIRITEPHLSGDVVGEMLKLELQQVIKDHRPVVVVVDMSPVTSISSSVIGALILAHRTLAKTGGDLRFCGMPSLVSDVLRSLNLLGTKFHVYADATAAFQAPMPRMDHDTYMRTSDDWD